MVIRHWHKVKPTDPLLPPAAVELIYSTLEQKARALMGPCFASRRSWVADGRAWFEVVATPA